MKTTPMPVQIMLRTSQDNKAWLKAKAQEQERSVNWLLHSMLNAARQSERTQENVPH